MINGTKFKLIYTDWYIEHGERKPFGNGIHPHIRKFIQNVIKNNLKIDYYSILQYETEHKAIKFDHSELINYFARNFKKSIISSNEINEDDDCIYIYPLEIRATLGALNDENIFLLEGEEYRWYLKDIIPNNILEYVKIGKVKILVNIIHDPLYDSHNIRQFELQMNKFGIDGSNIIFLGGSNFKEYYEMRPGSKVKIYNGHLFIKGYVDIMKQYPCNGDLGYMCDLVRPSDLDSTKIRPYKFLCNNKTMTKVQRVAAGYFTMKYDLLNEGKFSFIQEITKEKAIANLSAAIKNPDTNYIDKLLSILPYELDTEFLEKNQKAHFGANNNKKDWYSETYVNLVTETFFGHNVFLSEKIFKPISNLQPFIVLGDYKMLAELKKLGFKTFEPFIDESYDEEIDPYKRMEKIEIEIAKLKNKTIEEIHNWYYSIIDILIYNQNHLYTFEKYECFDSIFEQIENDYKN
jgi:hypothetical protein